MAEEATETPVDNEGADAPAQDSGPDLSEQFADLSNRVTQFIESQQQPEPEHQPLDILGVPDEDEGEVEEYAYDPYEVEEPASDPRVDQIWEWATKQEQQNIQTGLNALGDKYQDFTEKVPDIRTRLDEMGITDPAQRGNARLVENVYLALKAEADAAAETPAEEAASRGAKLERGASASAPEDVDPDAEFKKAFSDMGEKSAFG